MYELLPDESYLSRRAILLVDGKPSVGAEETYLGNDWAFKEKDMRANVINAMEFKRELGEELPRQEALLVLWYKSTDMRCNTLYNELSCVNNRSQAHLSHAAWILSAL